MSTTTHPTPPPPPSPDQPRPTRSSSRVIAILTIAFGVVVLIGGLWSSAVPTVAAAFTRDEERSVQVGGVRSLQVDIAATSLTVVFDDVREASLNVRDTGGGAWTFERNRDVLRLESPRTSFGSWFGSGNGTATLTLPVELEGIDGSFSLGAGSLDVSGTFGVLDLELGAGRMAVDGSAEALTAEMSAGRADLQVDSVATADLTVNAGTMVAVLSGSAPDRVDAAVNAGALDLTLPDEVYAVSSDVAAGEFRNDLRTGASASSEVSVDLSAGTVRLRSAG